MGFLAYLCYHQLFGLRTSWSILQLLLLW